MPECKSRDKIKEMIEDYGGICYDKYEAYTFEVKPDKEAESAKDFHTGKVYHISWLHESIEKK